MASFTIRDLPDWWPSMQAKARAEGWSLPRLIVQLLDDYRSGRIAPSVRAPGISEGGPPTS